MPIINSVVAGGGTTPTGTLPITNNGTYDVTNYATADVNVPTTAPALYREFEIDANGVLQPNTTTTHIMDFTGVKTIYDYALAAAYMNNTNISGAVDMSDLINVSAAYACYWAFYGCTGITSAKLSSLTQVSGDHGCAAMFFDCSGITTINISSLTTVNGTSGCSSMFYGCSSATSVDISSLATISTTAGCESMFRGCSGLTSVTLNALTNITAQRTCERMFQGCTSLTSLSFPALTSTSFGSRTNQFNSMLLGVTGCTVHFPSNLQSVIGSWTSVSSGFDGTNTTVLFDLPATS